MTEYFKRAIISTDVYKRQTYRRGKTATPLMEVGESRKTGSKTVFWPDPEIFEDIVFDYGTLEHRLREMAFLNKGVRIVPVSYTHLDVYKRQKHCAVVSASEAFSYFRK